MNKAANLASSMLKSVSVLIGSSMLTAGIVALSTPAHAFVLGCPSGIADNVGGTSGCQYSNSANQDSVSPNSPLTVNQESFFGFTNWKFGGKIGDNAAAGYTGNGSGQSGTWNIASAFQNTWQDVMLVFKSGRNTTLVGYMVNDNVTSGTWNSPFEKSLFDVPNTRDVSHISVYYREGSGSSAAVPEPTTMAGLALAGTGFAAMRRRRATAKA